MQEKNLSTLLLKLYDEKDYKKIEEKLALELEIYNSYDNDEYKQDILEDIPTRVKNCEDFWNGVTNKDLFIFASKAIQEKNK